MNLEVIFGLFWAASGGIPYLFHSSIANLGKVKDLVRITADDDATLIANIFYFIQVAKIKHTTRTIL